MMVYRFDAFELDMGRFELRKGSAVVPVEPQVFALLGLLVANHERMVSKDEIHDRIWNGRIVSEAALNSRIRSVRQAVGDNGTAQRVIRTVRSGGFRFVADVTTDSASLPAATPESVVSRHEPAVKADDAPPRRAVVSRPTVAVLPFENLSGDSDQEYFSDAVAGDIITALSKHRWLSVVGRNTTFGYKGQPASIRQMLDELRVNYVVEGGVRRAGNRIRVTA